MAPPPPKRGRYEETLPRGMGRPMGRPFHNAPPQPDPFRDPNENTSEFWDMPAPRREGLTMPPRGMLPPRGARGAIRGGRGVGMGRGSGPFVPPGGGRGIAPLVPPAPAPYVEEPYYDDEKNYSPRPPLLPSRGRGLGRGRGAGALPLMSGFNDGNGYQEDYYEEASYENETYDDQYGHSENYMNEGMGVRGGMHGGGMMGPPHRGRGGPQMSGHNTQAPPLMNPGPGTSRGRPNRGGFNPPQNSIVRGRGQGGRGNAQGGRGSAQGSRGSGRGGRGGPSGRGAGRGNVASLIDKNMPLPSNNLPMEKRLENLCLNVKNGPKFSNPVVGLETFSSYRTVCLAPAFVYKGERRDGDQPFTFDCKVYLNGVFISNGIATNKKDSKAIACENALYVLATTSSQKILSSHERVNISALGKQDADIVESAVKSGESNIVNVMSVADPKEKSVTDFFILEPEQVDAATGMNSTCILRQSADFSHMLLKYEFESTSFGFL